MNSKIIRTETLQVQVYDYLLQKIMDGYFPPGQRLIEEKLVEETGVSRSPIREAIRRLEKDGLVVVNPQGGVRVYNITQEDFQYLYECRFSMEPIAAKYAAERIKPGQILRLENVINEMEKAVYQNDVMKMRELNALFHTLIMEASENPYLVKMMKQLKVLINFYRNVLLKISMRWESGVKEHQAIWEAIRNKNGAAAEYWMKQHIKSDYQICLEVCHSSGRGEKADEQEKTISGN
jgi:DNA-binding GntR family transcriptional regulator